MTDKYLIYPQVNVETRMIDRDMVFYVRMWSKLRVYHLGKWYYQRFFREFNRIDPLKLAEITQIFHIDVYNTIHLGQVDLSLKGMDDKPLWELCEDQTDETERLKKISKLYFK
jgi:hypothetical protein